MKPLCFVLMPFGTKKDSSEKEINFDVVYQTFIKPAIEMAGLHPIRADEEQAGGFIHKPMYERLMFCDFAVADLSFANANVFYELGIRHALKPCTTVSIFETATRLPFDTAPLRAFNYDYMDKAVQMADEKIKSLASLIKANVNVKKVQHDSPIAQLITGYKFPNLNYLQQDADAFREWVISSHANKDALEDLVKQWKKLNEDKKKPELVAQKDQLDGGQQQLVATMVVMEKNMGDAIAYSYDILYALLNAYKSVSAFKEITAMLKPLIESTFSDNIYIKQQLALAYNKISERTESEKILKTITAQYGPDPETCGLLGAAYKGMMIDNAGNIKEASYRARAIEAYIDGFDADPRDYYPGINALNLMFYGNTGKDKYDKYLPLVDFAVERQLKKNKDDYWLQATQLELAILKDDVAQALTALSNALTCDPDEWSINSTKQNLGKLYRKKVSLKGESEMNWLKEIIESFN